MQLLKIPQLYLMDLIQQIIYILINHPLFVPLIIKSEESLYLTIRAKPMLLSDKIFVIWSITYQIRLLQEKVTTLSSQYIIMLAKGWLLGHTGNLILSIIKLPK
jgi:hypothetical protein